MMPPRPGDTIVHHGEEETRHEALCFKSNSGEVVTREGTFPWIECSVLERLSDQEIFDRAHAIELEGYPVRHFHAAVFSWDRRLSPLQ